MSVSGVASDLSVPDRSDLVRILSARDEAEVELVRAEAERVLLAECGEAVHLRGLVEASNACACDCHYCGIGKSQRAVTRYTLYENEIVACARHCARLGFGSMVIQSGERRDRAFLDLLVTALRRIKRETRTSAQPNGLGITLSIGQQTRETYRRLFDAGAHRYLLRIETSNPRLFARIHPASQTFDSRLECLAALRDTGFQIGTGVMIGLPGQTVDDLANDILFFARHDVDMIGMGPFIPHPGTQLGTEICPSSGERIRLSVLMIAATRIFLRNVNIAAATALQVLDTGGRETALRYGANVVMPQITPVGMRRNYQLYPGKPFQDEDSAVSMSRLAMHIAAAGRKIAWNCWGDSPHAGARQRRAAR